MITVTGILKTPQGLAISNAEIQFEQTRTSLEVVGGTKFSVLTSQTGQYSTQLGVGTFTFKIRLQDETQYRVVASNIVVIQDMNNYSINQIIQMQTALEDIDYDLAQEVLGYKNAAQASQAQALASQNQQKTSETNSKQSENSALASKNQAQTSEQNALSSKNQAQSSQTAQSSSQATASTKATEAQSSQSQASTSQTTATTKATESSNSATLAQKWAANPENSIVSGGLYSALHYAAKAAQSAQTAAGQLVWRGGWSAQSGNPPPTPTVTQDFYRITQPGTILSVSYQVGDYIHWDTINSVWFKMDGTDSVVSVNGQTGSVTLTQASVGALQSTGGALTGDLNQNISGYGVRLTVSGSTAYLQGGKVGGDTQDQKLRVTGHSQAPLTDFDIVTSQDGIAKVNGSKIFTESYKPKLDTTLGLQWDLPRPTAGQVRWVRIQSILRTDAECTMLVSGLGDHGQTARGTCFISMASRSNQVKVDINSTNTKLYGTTLFYTKDTGTRFELWMKTPSYQLVATVTRLTGTSDIIHNDFVTTEPTDLVLVEQKQLYSTGFIEGILGTNNQAKALKTSLLNTTSEIYQYDASLGDQGWPWANSSATIISTGWNRPDATAGAELAINISGLGLAFRAQNSTTGTLSQWKKVYHTDFPPTPQEVGALASTGGTLTGTLNIVNEGMGLVVRRTQYPNIMLDSSSLTTHRQKLLEVNASGTFNIITRDSNGVNQGVISIPPNVTGTVYTTGNKPTLDELDTYNKATIDGQSFSSITIPAPAGVVQGKYYPVAVYNQGQEHRLYIETRSSAGGDPMNFCSFEGYVQQGGWTDTGNYVVGQFNQYDTNERQIHSILGCSEAQTAFAVYVEARAFPITLRVRASATVVCTGQDIPYGTTIFQAGVTDPVQGVGTKTRVLADFSKGATHWYSSNSIVTRGGVSTQQSVVVNEGRTDVGSLAMGGNTQGYAEIAARQSTQSAFNYSQGLRYYNDDTWRIGDKRIVHEGDNTITGRYTFTQSAASIVLNVPTGQSSYILGRKQGTDNWWIGRGSQTSDDVTLYSYVHNNYIELKADRVVQGKQLYVGNNQVYHSGNETTPQNIGAVPTSLLEQGSGSVARVDGQTLQGKQQQSPVLSMLAGSSGILDFRNKIINGSFDIWQRGISGVSNGAIYGPDRFIVWAQGANTNWVRAGSGDFAPLTDSVGWGLKWWGDPQSTAQPLEQRIEGVHALPLINSIVTVSFTAKSSLASEIWSIEFTKPNNYENWQSGTVSAGTTKTVTVGQTATRFSITTTLNNVRNGLSLIVRPASPTATHYITDIVLEPGNVATPLERRPVQVELQLCQRYFCSTFNKDVTPQYGQGLQGAILVTSYGSGGGGTTWKYPVTMRAIPALASYNPVSLNSTWRDITNGADRPQSVAMAAGVSETDILFGTSQATAAFNFVHMTANAEL